MSLVRLLSTVALELNVEHNGQDRGRRQCAKERKGKEGDEKFKKKSKGSNEAGGERKSESNAE